MRYSSRRRSRAKLWLVALAVAVFAVVLSIFIYDAVDNSRRLNRQREFEDRVRALNVEKNELRQRADKLSKAVTDQLGSGACMPIVVYGTDVELYDLIFPLFGEAEGTDALPSSGVLALSPTELPDLEGRISRYQFDQMVEAGWEIAIYWDGEGDMIEYIDYMNIILNGLGVPSARTVLFRHGAYKTEYDPSLYQRGVRHIIHSGEENLEYIQRDVPEEGQIWRVGAVGWNTYGVSSTMLGTVLSTGGAVAFTVDFTAGTSAYDGTNDACVASFGRMMERLDESRFAKDLFVTGLDFCEDIRRQYLSQAADILGENADFISQLEQMIEEVDARIAEIYNEYK